MLLSEFRQQYPMYGDLSDAELADGLHRKFYSDIPRFEFDQKLGLAVNAEPSWAGDPNAIATPPDMTPRFPGGGDLPSVGFEMQQPEPMPQPAPMAPTPSGLGALSVEPAATGAVPVMPSLTQALDLDEDRWGIGGAGSLDYALGGSVPAALDPVPMPADPYSGTPDWQAYPGLVVRGAAETGLGMGMALEALPQQQTDETRAFYDEYLTIQPGDRDTAEDLIRRVQRSAMTPGRKSIFTQAIAETVRSGAKMGSRDLGIDVPVDTETGTRYGRAREVLRETFPASDEQEQSLPGQVARGIGSTVGFLPFSVVPGGIWAAGALSGAGEAADRAYRTGASPEQQGTATTLGMVPGALDALAIDSIIRGVTRTPGAAGWLRAIALTGLRTGAIEGTTEGVQQAMQNVIARVAYDPDAAIAEGVPESALVGMLSGGALGAVGGAFSRSPRDPVAAPVDPRQEPPPLATDIPPAPDDPVAAAQEAVRQSQEVRARAAATTARNAERLGLLPDGSSPPVMPGPNDAQNFQPPAAIPAGAQPGEAIIGPVEPPPAPSAPPAALPRVPAIDLPQAAGFPTDQGIGVQPVPEAELQPPAPEIAPGVRVRIDTPTGPAEGTVIEAFQEPRPEQPGGQGARSAPAFAVQLDSGETVDVAPDRARIEVVAPVAAAGAPLSEPPPAKATSPIPTEPRSSVPVPAPPATDVARAVPEELTAEQPTATYQTAKGSRYQVFADGTTVRDKAARPEHPGDQGIKDRTERTVYLDMDGARALAPPNSAKWRVIDHGDGTASLATRRDDGRWGISQSARNIPFTTEPAVGRVPLELWGREAVNGLPGYGKAHFGNAITAVQDAAAPANAMPERAPPPSEQANIEQTPSERAQAAPMPAPVSAPSADARTERGLSADGHPRMSGAVEAAPADTIQARVIDSDTAITPAGTDVPVRYAVVELDSLIPSQTDEGSPNPRFTGEQPRDRSRAASQAQIAEIAGRLDPRRLDRNPSTADGAPLVGPDGMVDSGNGRVLALRRAYAATFPSARRYRDHLAQQGYPVEGMRQPVLVRINDAAPEMRARIASESNARSTLAMSATEQAMADAKAMATVLPTYRGGEVTAAANRDFVRRFIDQAVGAGDRGTIIDSQGQLSGPGIRRIQAAMLAAAYGDANIVETLVESADNDIKAIGGALVDAAPAWAQMRQEAEAGQIDPDMATYTPDLLEAVRLVQRARADDQHVADMAAQIDMFGGRTISEGGEGFLRLFFRDTRFRSQRGRAKIAEALTFYAEEARKTQPGAGLFGDAERTQPADILTKAREKIDGPEQQQGDLLAQNRQERVRDSEGVPPTGRDAGQRAPVQPADRAGDRGAAAAESARGADAGRVPDPVAPAAAPRARRRSARDSLVEAYADYFQPGNIVASYAGHDRVVAFDRDAGDGRWAVTVRKVQRAADGAWVDAPRERDRVHSTAPSARDLKAGPTVRADSSPAAQMALGEQPEAVPPLDPEALKAELRRIAPLASMQVIDRIAVAGRGPMNGAYYPAFRGIVVAATGPNPMNSLRHEAVHALRDLNLIRPEEWRRLSARAEAEWIDRYDIETRYPSLSREGQVEEAVAEAFADHVEARLPAGFKAIWDNIKRFLDRLGAWLRGQGFQTVEDVLGRIERGEVGARDVAPGQGRGTAAAFQAGRVPADVFGPRSDIRALRQRAMAFARDSLFGRDFVNQETGMSMRVNRRGIEKIFHGGGLAPEKIEAVAAIPDIISGGRMDMRLPDLDGSDRIDYLIFRSDVEIGGTPYDVRFVARRGDGGTFYYDHELSEMRERPAGSRGGVASEETVAGSPPTERPSDDIAPPRPDDKGDAKYQVPASVPPAQRSRSVLDAIRDGQPIDRIMRLPFRLLGGVTERGEWKPGLRLADWGAEVVTERKLDPDGRFAWLNPAIEKARAGLIDRYGQDPEYVARDRKRQNEETTRARQGLEIVRGLVHDGMDANEAAILQAVLTGEPIPPGKWEKVAPGIRAAIDEMGADAMALGLISAESYERNRGAYLNRSYLKHEAHVEGGGLGRLAQNMGKSQRVKLIGSELKGRGIFIEIDPEEIDPKHRVRGTMIQVLDDARPDTTGKMKNWARAFVPAGEAVPAKYADWTDKGSWEVRQTAPGKLVLWRDYTKAERERMGEILDARYTIAKTFYLMAHDLATGRFYQDIATNEAWATRMQPPEGSWVNAREANIFAQLATDVEWVKVPDTAIEGTAGVKKWGALAGMYVRSEIWRDLNQVAAMANRNAWDYVLSQWKLNKTARSPVTHMNNVMSNILFMDMNDVRMQDLVQGVRSYRAGDQDFKEAEANGAFGTGFVGAEIRREVLEPILREIEAEATGKKSVGAVTRWLNQMGAVGRVMAGLGRAVKKADEKMLSAYRAEDDVFRMALYKRRRAMGDSAEAAANAAREVFLDYDIRAPWVNAVRRMALPFIAYTYRAVPGVAKAVATKPWKLAKYALLAQMANIAAYSMWPGDEDEERRNLRKDQRGHTWVGSPRMLRLWVDSDGPNFLDIRRWIPAGDIFDLNQGSPAVPLPSWLQLGGPLQVGIELMMNRSNFTGKDIVNMRTDDGLDRAGKVADYLWKSWAPSAVWVPGGWYQSKVIDALSGVRDRTGNQLDPLKALVSSFGIKVQGMDLNQAKYWRQAAYETVKRDLAFERNRAIDDHARGAMSDSAYRSTLADIAAKEKRAEAEVADILKDAAFQQWLKQFEAKRRTVRSNARREAKQEAAPASP